MVVHRCQLKEIKITKIKKNKKIKNENKKIEKIKKYYSEKQLTEISWPVGAKSGRNLLPGNYKKSVTRLYI